jgi:hypothetical protein
MNSLVRSVEDIEVGTKAPHLRCPRWASAAVRCPSVINSTGIVSHVRQGPCRAVEFHLVAVQKAGLHLHRWIGNRESAIRPFHETVWACHTARPKHALQRHRVLALGRTLTSSVWPDHIRSLSWLFNVGTWCIKLSGDIRLDEQRSIIPGIP